VVVQRQHHKPSRLDADDCEGAASQVRGRRRARGGGWVLGENEAAQTTVSWDCTFRRPYKDAPVDGIAEELGDDLRGASQADGVLGRLGLRRGAHPAGLAGC